MLKIHTHHFDLTPAIENHANEKFKKLLGLHPKITHANLILKAQTHEKVAEGELHIKGNHVVFASSTHEDLYHAIDLLLDKLLPQLIKIKEKQKH